MAVHGEDEAKVIPSSSSSSPPPASLLHQRRAASRGASPGSRQEKRTAEPQELTEVEGQEEDMLPGSGTEAAERRVPALAQAFFTPAEARELLNYGGGFTVDNSLLYAHVVSPFCAWAVTLMPSWLAPNVLTIFGWLCNFVMYLMVFPHILTLTDAYPTSVNYICAFFTLAYLLADACDGKQAVRTGSSSHFGELLDHSIDAAVMSFQMLCTIGAVRGGTEWALYLCIAQQILFYSFHWREQFEENLQLGKFNGPTEALVIQITMHLFTAYVGSDWWRTPFGFVAGWTYGDAWLALAMVLTLATVAQNFVIGMGKASEQRVPLGKQFLPAAAVLISTLFSLIWALGDFEWFTACAASSVYGGASMTAPVLTPAAHCGYRVHMFGLLLNAFFAILSINCMVERMCKMESKVLHKAQMPLMISSVIAVAFGDSLVNRETLLEATLAVGFATLVYFGWCIAQTFCPMLGIKFWTIPYPNKGTRD